MDFQEIACTSHQWKATNLAERGQNTASSNMKRSAGVPIGSVPIRVVFQLQARDEAAEGTEGIHLHD